MTEQRTVQVTGAGLLKLKPDLCRVQLTLQGLERSYADALSRASRDSASLADAIAAPGFRRDELKTLDFSVDTEYESVQDDKGHWRQEFRGYRFTQSLLLEFPVDNALLGRTLAALTAAPVDPEFHLSYGLRDPESAKAALLEAAVADARRKAELLTAAAGEKLGPLLHIDYSMAEIRLHTAPMAKAMLSRNESADFDMEFTPEDIRAQDTVTLVWAIA